MFSNKLLTITFKKITLATAAVALFCALPTSRLEASCGLHVCPIPVAVGREKFPSQAYIEPVYTAFDIGGKGSFVQTNLVGVYEHRLFRLGAVMSVVYLNDPSGKNTVGLANPLPYGEVYIYNGSQTKFSVGSQFELALGNHDDGLGEDHYMAMPYLNFWQTINDLRLAVQVGYLQALSHDSHGATVYVNPHSDSELAARLVSSYTWLSTLTGELSASLRQVMDHDASGDKTFLDLGTAVRVQMTSSMALRGGINIPITSTQRYLYQAFVGYYYYF
jgi:hypothetical protein